MPSNDRHAHRWLIGSVLLGWSVAVLVAWWMPLATEPSKDRGVSEVRASVFRDQAAVGKAASEAAWQPWFQALEIADARLRVGPRFIHPPLADRAMVDSSWEELADRDAANGPLAALVDFAAQLKHRNIDFLVLPVPPLSAVYPRSSVAGAPSGDDVPQYLDWRLREFYARLEDHGIEVLDLLPTFLDPPPQPAEVMGLDAIDDHSRASVELMFRIQDRHWTARASDLAASRLAARIRGYPWFDEVSSAMGRAVIDDQWFIETGRGPLAERLIRAGVLPADYLPEHFVRHVARPIDEVSSFSDRESPILIVGDSFAGPEYGLLDSLLIELGFRVDFVLTQGIQPSHQLDVLRLRGDELAGKRLVIWEFTVATIGTPELWRPVSVIPMDGAEP